MSNKISAVLDDNGVPIGVGFGGINEITQDTFIPYVAIRDSSPITHYIEGAPGVTKIWPADSWMVLDPATDVRLSSTTTCWTIGTRAAS